VAYVLMSQPIKDSSMTSNDFAANLYDIEVTFVTVAYGSIIM